ncbi:ubiquitin-conjugating enzyme [Pyrrhoderma noxium]|uniref:Ubiquitin-conjugating enzyme n=1 Tax=Pyrrhoderma noxium TaxID=2282107 RepID=A0A286U893_9AGAM|nr:ubiquitin-conjugating enzyme [Pyrrhoderma noxium]
MSSSTAVNLLTRQLKELTKNPVEGFSAGLVDDNILEWRIGIIGPEGSLYENGYLTAHLTFTENYPNEPPTMRFVTKMWHPNIYPDGRVCISILHQPGDDQFGYEQAGERWLPIHTVESIILSVISLLTPLVPDISSPANIDAAIEVRDNLKSYQRKVRRLAEQSLEDAYQ